MAAGALLTNLYFSFSSESSCTECQHFGRFNAELQLSESSGRAAFQGLIAVSNLPYDLTSRIWHSSQSRRPGKSDHSHKKSVVLKPNRTQVQSSLPAAPPLTSYHWTDAA
ncbi:hypothetical protein K439DRAFT_1636249 [Ramaria rubella]|nr:hypothetical protein K439DRAFT_1636249 [Ramaria rubella]